MTTIRQATQLVSFDRSLSFQGEFKFETEPPFSVELRSGSSVYLRGEGADLFDALVAVRRELEATDLLAACNGSRADVYPSRMQRQSALGRRAYVLTLPRTARRPRSVDIFEPAPADAEIVGVDAQLAFFRFWAKSELQNDDE